MVRSSVDARTELAFTGDRHYLDTIGRHLLHRNKVFECDIDNGEFVLWLRRGKMVVAGPIRQPVMPTFIADVADFDLRRRLGNGANSTELTVIGLRSIRYELMRVRNKDKKTIAWLYVEQFGADLGGEHHSPVVVHLAALRGYRKDSRRVARILRENLPRYVLSAGYTPMGPDQVTAALPDQLTVRKQRLSRGASIGDGVVNILSTNFRLMTAKKQGIELDLDIEYLHDFRIALRRMRSILGAFESIFAPDAGILLKPNLRWLNKVTGPRRDLDVYLNQFPQMVGSATRIDRAPLRQMYQYIAAERRCEQDKLVKALSDDRYAIFERDWSRFLSAPPVNAAAANRDITGVSGASIWKTYKRIIKQIRSPDITRHIDALHTLRKECKKLRYQIEAFELIYPKKQLAKAVAELKHLQDILGAVCDNSVQQRFLVQRQSGILEQVHDTVQFAKLLDDLLGHYGAQERLMLRTISRDLDRFESKTVMKTYRSLFEL